jgi:hypothetical protein
MALELMDSELIPRRILPSDSTSRDWQRSDAYIHIMKRWGAVVSVGTPKIHILET